MHSEFSGSRRWICRDRDSGADRKESEVPMCGTKGMLGLRIALLVLAGVLAAFLIARGTVVIGVLVGAMAVLRAVMLAAMYRRRQEFARRFPNARERFFSQMASSRPRSAFRTDAGTRSPSSPS
jgi:Flp pilus assembly protein TadB